LALVDMAKHAFTSGEISPRLLGRQDVERYKNGAIILENWMPLLQGGVTRRPGLRYVATVKDSTKLTLLKPFEPSTLDAYILEVGHGYFRFYKNGARIESPPGTPVEVVTPYQEVELRTLRTAQANDIMIWVHVAHAPMRLARLSDTSWEFRLLPFDPPPLFEAGDSAPITLTLGSTAPGPTTVTASSPYWLASDAQRMLTSGAGRALLTGALNTAVMDALVLDAFASPTLPAGTWTIEGSPWADIDPSGTGPVGSTILLSYGVSQSGEFERMTTPFASWTDYSGTAILSTGVNTGPTSTDTLEDAGADFQDEGVLTTHIVRNVTDGSEGVVSSVTPKALQVSGGLFGGTDNDFDNGDSYQVRETGTSRVSAGILELNGGTAGHGWREAGVGTDAGAVYEVRFTVVQASLSVQVGSAPQLSDLFDEASYLPGDHVLTFTAAGGSSYVQVRNNQNQWAGVSVVSVKQYSIAVRTTSFVGQYIRLHGGLVQVLSVVPSGNQARVIETLDSDAIAPAGAWELLSPAWSDTLGWPGAVVLYEGRLHFGGSPRFPQTIWSSGVDDLLNFNIGTNPSDPLELSLVDSGGNITLNRLRWLMPAENMLTGTTHGEYRLVGAGDDPLSPTSPPRTRIQSTFGSDSVQPLKVGSALIFVQRQGSKVREMSYDETTQTTFVARDLTITSEHLLRTAVIEELAYQAEPVSTIWAVRNDGVLLGLTYDQPEQIAAWWRCTTPSGRVESVATIPHPTAAADQVWCAVQRFIGSVLVRYIEVMDATTPMLLRTPVTVMNGLTEAEEIVSGFSGLTLDAATLYSGPATTTIAAPQLVGHTVYAVADGAVLPAQVVPAGGVVTLPVPASTIWVGLPFASVGRTDFPDVAVRGPNGQRIKKRYVRLLARLEQSACLVLHGERIPFRSASMPQDQGVVPFSGDKEVTPLGFSQRAVVEFIVDQPLPCTLISLFGTLDIEADR
jgi:hypothetical protein